MPHHQFVALAGLHSSLTDRDNGAGDVVGINMSMTRQVRARLTQIHSIHLIMRNDWGQVLPLGNVKT